MSEAMMYNYVAIATYVWDLKINTSIYALHIIELSAS